MISAVRMISFLVAAIGVQIVSGLGLAALVMSVLFGWFQFRFYWLLAPWLLFTFSAAHLNWDSVASKVIDAQSNLPFLAIVYAIICISGFVFGAFIRRSK